MRVAGNGLLIFRPEPRGDRFLDVGESLLFVFPLLLSPATESALALQKRSDEQVHGRAHQVVDRGDQEVDRGAGGAAVAIADRVAEGICAIEVGVGGEG